MDALAGIWSTLLEPYRDSDLVIYLVVAIGASAFFFLVSLVPLQHYAANYTRLFFQHLREHLGLVAGYGISLAILLGMARLRFAPATVLREFLAATGLILILVIIAILWWMTSKLFDSLDRAIEAIEEEKQADLRKLQ